MQTTPFHAMYYSKQLRDFHFGEEKLLPAFLMSANMEIHPHQVETALFALRSSKQKGVILADETGLGKSIEALLIIAQKWYEGQQRILLIAPIHLLHQWQNELEEKLLLPHILIDNNSVLSELSGLSRLSEFSENKNSANSENPNPFLQEAIILTTYDFAAEKSDLLSEIDWDVTIFEEAHRLRKVYTGENKSATSIKNAVEGSFKILLTATPMQNNILDLYGLINFIDETEFTDEETFKLRYMNSLENFEELALRTQKIAFRTMRNQIKRTVKNPERINITADFELTQPEQQLYDKLFSYIKRPHRYAYPKMREYDLTLMFLKTFSSSTFALTETLKGAKERLEDIYSKNPRPDIKGELTTMTAMLELCKSITKNAKGQALVEVLETSFVKLKEMNAKRKAVIFTENRSTQKYLYKLLNKGKYKDKVLLFNGSKSRDYETIMKFQKSAQILIATDIAAEGLNMAFCSLVIHYDLPYNVQLIEHRIGRCHRNGQKCDVLSVSFLNKNNFADVRMLQLINKRMRDFQGMFGVSDNIIGNFDTNFEEDLARIMSLARSKADVDKAFEKLQQRYQTEIQEIAKQAKTALFTSFDPKVYKNVRLTPDYVNDKTSEINAMMWAMAKQFFKDVHGIYLTEETRTIRVGYNPPKVFTGTRLGRDEYSIDDKTLPKSGRITLGSSIINNIIHELSWRGVYEKGEIVVIDNAKAFDSCTIGFYEVEVKRSFFEKDEYFIFAGVTDDGTALDDTACRKIMELPVISSSVSGQWIGGSNRHTIRQYKHPLDENINAEPFIEKTRKHLSIDYDADIENLDYACTKEKMGLDIALANLKTRLKQAEKADTNASTPMEKLLAKKAKATATQEIKRQENSLFMEKMAIEKKYEDEKAKLRDALPQLEAKVIRLFLIECVIRNA